VLENLNLPTSVEVKRDREECTLELSQTTYVCSLLRKFNMENCKAVSVPLDPTVQLIHKQCPKKEEEFLGMKNIPCRELIGGLVVFCMARPEALKPAKPGPAGPSRAGPYTGLHQAQGSGLTFFKP
jgi:hypothetical protein